MSTTALGNNLLELQKLNKVRTSQRSSALWGALAVPCDLSRGAVGPSGAAGGVMEECQSQNEA